MDYLFLKICALMIGAGAAGGYIGYRCGKKYRQPKKTVHSEEHIDEGKIVPDVDSERVEKNMLAKEAFLENVDLFKSKFNSLLDGTYNCSEWNELIVSVNNNDLIDLWGRINHNVSAILRIIATWGVKHEDCVSFVGAKYYRNMYVTSNGEEIKDGVSYMVITPCWLMTEFQTGNKSVIVKGVVKI